MAGTLQHFAIAVVGLVIMQSAYWYAHGLHPASGFVIESYWVISCCVLARLVSFLSALATVAAFDHWKRSQFVLWKAMLLVSAIFAFLCYKHQLASVGDALLEIQPERGEKAAIDPKGTAKL